MDTPPGIQVLHQTKRAHETTFVGVLLKKVDSMSKQVLDKSI